MPQDEKLPDHLEMPIATQAQIHSLQGFARDLAILCDRYGVDLLSSSGVDVQLREDARPTDLKHDFPYVASFQGVGPEGVFNRDEQGLLIEPYWVDHYNLDLMIKHGILTAEGEIIPR